MPARTMQLFMLEPDEDDRLLTKSVFTDKEYPVHLSFFRTDHELLGLLTTLEATHYPDLVLVSGDLKPDGKTLDFITTFKSVERYNWIPVVVVSNQLPPDQVIRFYQAGAGSFIAKPFTNDLAMKKMDVFVKYWLEVVELPKK
jgi:DNA-binding NtrC family response regulator